MSKVLKRLYLGDVVKSFGTKRLRKLTTEEPITIVPYLTFTSPNSFTLKTYNAKKNWDGELEYSTDTKTWNVWSGTTTLSADSGKLYLRGTGNTKITGSEGNRHWVLSGSEISCCGNIENLLDYATVVKNEHPTMGEYCYRSMFYNCTSLTTAPELPATTLADFCYASMFSDCTSLTTEPELPATTLAEGCYSQMFYGCTSLTTAPKLSATTLAEGCYGYMFRDCTNLTTAPELPATTLAEGCYSQMFYGCTSLTTAPELPATTLAERCYYGMFRRCTSLTTAPKLPAKTLATQCYSQMFYDCTSLTTAPELPATTLAEGCYADMFNNCTGIILNSAYSEATPYKYRIPTSGAGTTASDALTRMFARTGGTFTGTPSINTTYYTSNTVV